jgi:hypothetical protein
MRTYRVFLIFTWIWLAVVLGGILFAAAMLFTGNPDAAWRLTVLCIIPGALAIQSAKAAFDFRYSTH